MKNVRSIAVLLVLTFFIAGCGERIKTASIRTPQLKIGYPQISGMKDMTIQKKINSVIYSTAFKLRDENGPEVETYKGSYTYYVAYEISLRGKDILSMRLLECLSMPRYAHPFNKVCALTIDMKSGSVYSLAQLFEPKSSWKETINGIIKEKIKKNSILLLKEFKGIDKDQEFFITKGYLAVFWQEAEYLPRYLGPFTVLIERSRISDIMRKDIKF
jgi:hypothetical protein